MAFCLKRKMQTMSISLMYKFSCLHSKERSKKCFKEKYKVSEEIGRGGFGVVYRGYRLSDGLPVAIKFVRHKCVRQWTKLEKQLIPSEICLLEESQSVDGVVRLLDWFAGPKGFLIVMERPEHCMDLFDVIGTYGRLDEVTARTIFIQVIETVIGLIRQRLIVHRDIKDENIIVDMDTGRIKLVDFGAAEYFERTRLQQFQGTRSYCPPEWFKSQIYLPVEATVWSLGVLLYILVVGTSPFRNEVQICIGRVRFPDFISEECKSLVKRCLCLAPECRISLEGIRSHPWMRCATLSKCSRSRRFHKILHKRSIKLRRRGSGWQHKLRRDGEQNDGASSSTTDDDLHNSDVSSTDSSSDDDEECSYRQGSRLGTPTSRAITIPAHVVASAAAAAARMKTGDSQSSTNNNPSSSPAITHNSETSSESNKTPDAGPASGTIMQLSQLVPAVKANGAHHADVCSRASFSSSSPAFSTATFDGRSNSSVTSLVALVSSSHHRSTAALMLHDDRWSSESGFETAPEHQMTTSSGVHRNDVEEVDDECSNPEAKPIGETRSSSVGADGGVVACKGSIVTTSAIVPEVNQLLMAGEKSVEDSQHPESSSGSGQTPTLPTQSPKTHRIVSTIRSLEKTASEASTTSADYFTATEFDPSLPTGEKVVTSSAEGQRRTSACHSSVERILEEDHRDEFSVQPCPQNRHHRDLHHRQHNEAASTSLTTTDDECDANGDVVNGPDEYDGEVEFAFHCPDPIGVVDRWSLAPTAAGEQQRRTTSATIPSSSSSTPWSSESCCRESLKNFGQHESAGPTKSSESAAVRCWCCRTQTNTDGGSAASVGGCRFPGWVLSNGAVAQMVANYEQKRFTGRTTTGATSSIPIGIAKTPITKTTARSSEITKNKHYSKHGERQTTNHRICSPVSADNITGSASLGENNNRSNPSAKSPKKWRSRSARNLRRLRIYMTVLKRQHRSQHNQFYDEGPGCCECCPKNAHLEMELSSPTLAMTAFTRIGNYTAMTTRTTTASASISSLPTANTANK